MFDRYGYIYYGPGTNPIRDRVDIEKDGFRTTIVPVPEPLMAVEVAGELQKDGVQLIELCGAFGPTISAKVIEATGGLIPIGSVSYGSESVSALVELTAEETLPETETPAKEEPSWKE